MTRIALLSDTHGYLDQKILNQLTDVDQIWHAGDFGTIDVCNRLNAIKPLTGVYGNVDGTEIRSAYPLHQIFKCENVKVWITHIGGYPGNYSPTVAKDIYTIAPHLFISGHSHILKVMRDKKMPSILHVNPGAAGVYGFHDIRTLIKFTIDKTLILEMVAVELGKRSEIV